MNQYGSSHFQLGEFLTDIGRGEHFGSQPIWFAGDVEVTVNLCVSGDRGGCANGDDPIDFQLDPLRDVDLEPDVCAGIDPIAPALVLTPVCVGLFGYTFGQVKRSVAVYAAQLLVVIGRRFMFGWLQTRLSGNLLPGFTSAQLFEVY